MDEIESPIDSRGKVIDFFLDGIHPEKVYFGFTTQIGKDESRINAWDTTGRNSEQSIQTATLRNIVEVEDPDILLNAPIRLMIYSFSGDEIRRVRYYPLYKWPLHLQELYEKADKIKPTAPEDEPEEE
jgi:hypothetical protein